MIVGGNLPLHVSSAVIESIWADSWEDLVPSQMEYFLPALHTGTLALSVTGSDRILQILQETQREGPQPLAHNTSTAADGTCHFLVPCSYRGLYQSVTMRKEGVSEWVS